MTSTEILHPFDRFPLKAHGEAIEQILSPAARQKPVWILGGTRGIGKATAALHLASRLLSVQDDPLFADTDAGAGAGADAPIGAAEESVCQLIRAGAHPDLKIIRLAEDDTRKNIPVDDIRAMRQFLSMTPSMGAWRVVVVDALDDLNINGANAMLKALEETPKNCMILLISHAPGRVLPTIRSRAQMMRLAPLDPADCHDIITKIDAEIDGGGAEAEALDLAVHLAEGAPGRGVLALTSGGAALYAETLRVLNNAPKLAGLEAVAAKWGEGEARHAPRRYMGMLVFDRLLSRAAKNESSTLPPTLPQEQTAITALNTRHGANKLAEMHQEFLNDWHEGDALNLAMQPMMLRLLLRLAYA